MQEDQRVCPVLVYKIAYVMKAWKRLLFPFLEALQVWCFWCRIDDSRCNLFQARRVLIDSNGQRKEETPRISKIFTTPRMQQHSDNCHGTITPRALFPLHEDVAPSSAGRVAQEVPCSDLALTPALCVKGPATQGHIKETHKIIGEKSVQKTGARKRARDEVDGAKLDGSLITTRSKTKWTNTGFFSTSSAVRLTVGNHNQKDITRTPRSAINHQPERKSKGNTTPAEKQTKQEEGDLKKLEDSTNIKESLKPLDLAKKVWGLGSPAIRVRVHSPGHRSLLRSPLVTPSAQSTARRKLVHSQGSAKQASARKNLASMLLVEKWDDGTAHSLPWQGAIVQSFQFSIGMIYVHCHEHACNSVVICIQWPSLCYWSSIPSIQGNQCTAFGGSIQVSKHKQVALQIPPGAALVEFDITLYLKVSSPQ